MSKEEGVGIETATISIDQLLPQLPAFSWTTFLTILDAVDTWKNRLKSARINKTMWGGAVIRKLKNPALENLLPSVVKDQKFDEIVSALKEQYDMSHKIHKRFIEAHQNVGAIQDPSSSSVASLKSMRGHMEVMDNVERHIQLSTEEDISQTIISQD